MSEYNAEFVKSEIFYNLINENYKKNFKITGTVKWFNRTKGYIESEGGDDMFVHKSDVDGFINEGDKVTCSILVVKKGSEFKVNAKNVKKIQ
jgi:cold shock protein